MSPPMKLQEAIKNSIVSPSGSEDLSFAISRRQSKISARLQGSDKDERFRFLTGYRSSQSVSRSDDASKPRSIKSESAKYREKRKESATLALQLSLSYADLRWFLVDEEGPESTKGDDGRRAPHDDCHGPRHDGCDLVGKHHRQERGEAPYRGLQASPAGPGAALQGAEAEEQQQEIRVGDPHEDQGRQVVP
ncbi:hypothetical protein Cni_G02590 [Canna indica]|uniref:Uncharacterized protein n=1 Tax=Canna indica TaxID=4628 RepID=A0AAQ3JPH3_9LILI|nr:hypothetical protein Cni_G02590 [Canna indica]